MPLSASFPDLRALDLYASVVKLGSLGRAARAHGIAQPSASSRIQNLERQLGLQLLDRSPTGSTPTPPGRVVAGWAHEILRAAKQLEGGLAALKAEQVGQLRIAASYTIAEYLLPGWLSRFLGDRPGDTVALAVANSTAVLDLLERGEADLGFIETPLTTPSMSEIVVAHDELVAVVRPGHPWADTRVVSAQRLSTTPLVMRETGSGTREALEAALRDSGLDAAQPVLELGSTAAVRAAVLSGNSPTVISRLAVAADIDNEVLVQVQIDGLRIHRRLRAVWPQRKPLARLAQALVEELAPSDGQGDERVY